MKARCKHDIGWFSVRPHHLFAKAETDRRDQRVIVGFGGRRNKVLMKCNNASCRAYRNAYFDMVTDAFTKFGNVRYIEEADR